MAVQQNKKSPSKRGMHRSHNGLAPPGIAVEPTTGETHLRHHVSPERLLPWSSGHQVQDRRLFDAAGGVGHRPAWAACHADL